MRVMETGLDEPGDDDRFTAASQINSYIVGNKKDQELLRSI
jgi:hypothetical protein